MKRKSYFTFQCTGISKYICICECRFQIHTCECKIASIFANFRVGSIETKWLIVVGVATEHVQKGSYGWCVWLLQSSARWQHMSTFIELGVRAVQSIGSRGRQCRDQEFGGENRCDLTENWNIDIALWPWKMQLKRKECCGYTVDSSCLSLERLGRLAPFRCLNEVTLTILINIDCNQFVVLST